MATSMDTSGYDKEKGIVLPATLESIPQVLAFVEGGLEELHCPNAMQMLLVVAVDEIVSNIAKYGYPHSAGDVTVRLCAGQDGEFFDICFIDQGIAFNPLCDTPQFDASAAVAQRRIGGQGVKIVRRIADEVEYERKESNNILVIRKFAKQ